jgi:NAD+ kinase
MLDVRIEGGDNDGLVVRALNEAVIERTSESNTIRIGVELDGAFFTTYACDGLIVATATGSTAYAFSVRGPILAATHRAQLLTPVSPHMLFDRSLVLEAATVTRLEVRGDRPASLSVDGRTLGMLRDGDALVCTESTHDAQLVTFEPRDFHAVLKAKFGLNDR